MRYFGIFLIVILFIIAMLIIVGIGARNQEAKRNRPANNPTSTQAKGLNARAIRQLDQIMVDPTLIGSPDWKDANQEILDEWYGRK